MRALWLHHPDDATAVARGDEFLWGRDILVAPVTRTIRGIPTEVPVGADEGLPSDGVASMDNVLPFPKSLLVRRLGSLAPERRGEPCEALRAATDC